MADAVKKQKRTDERGRWTATQASVARMPVRRPAAADLPSSGRLESESVGALVVRHEFEVDSLRNSIDGLLGRPATSGASERAYRSKGRPARGAPGQPWSGLIQIKSNELRLGETVNTCILTGARQCHDWKMHYTTTSRRWNCCAL